jgi:hypothetical protein
MRGDYDSEGFKPVITFNFGVETEHPDFVVVAVNSVGFQTVSFFELVKWLHSSGHLAQSK